jgi:hypothetical protein
MLWLTGIVWTVSVGRGSVVGSSELAMVVIEPVGNGWSVSCPVLGRFVFTVWESRTKVSVNSGNWARLVPVSYAKEFQKKLTPVVSKVVGRDEADAEMLDRLETIVGVVVVAAGSVGLPGTGITFTTEVSTTIVVVVSSSVHELVVAV